MRVSYWSNSKFAASLRKMGGIEPQPCSLTWEGWEEYKSNAVKANPFVYGFIESLDKLQKTIYWPYDTYTDIRNYISNVKYHTHVLRTTRGKRGQWSDLVSRIPDAMFTAIIDYVELECSNMTKMDHELNDTKLDKKISNGELGIKWLSRYGEYNDGEDYGPWIEKNNKIIEIYNFAKKYFYFDPYKLAKEKFPCNETKVSFLKLKEHDKYYKEVTRLEKEFDKKCKYYQKMIVDLQDYLWT